jgi:GntR family transcriptional regulator
MNFQENGTPLYVQIANSIVERIRSGEFATGDRLPSERTLCEELSVSRMTVRQALQTLQRQGLIEQQRGKGSFVSGPKIEQPIDVLIGFSDNMARRGLKPGARLLTLELQYANRRVAQALGLELGQPIYFIHRVRLADNIPMALEHSYFPAHRCPSLEQYDLEQRSVYAILAEEFGIHLKHARQSLEPTNARPHEAELLKVPVGVPLMLVERVSYDDQGAIVEYAKDLYRGDSFRFVSGSAPPGT